MVTVLIAARALNRAGALTLPFLALLLGRRLHASTDQIGLIMSGYGLATIPSRLTGGRLTDALGARATIVLGLLATAAAQVAIACSSTRATAAASIIGLGLVFEIYEPPTQSLLADHTPVADHPRVFGRLAAALSAAGIVAGLVASLLGRLDLRWLFLADAATCTGCAAVVFAAVRQPSPLAHASPLRPIKPEPPATPTGAPRQRVAKRPEAPATPTGAPRQRFAKRPVAPEKPTPTATTGTAWQRMAKRPTAPDRNAAMRRAVPGAAARQPQTLGRRGPGELRAPRGYRRALRDRRLLALLAVGTVFAVVYLQATVVLPLTLAARHRPPGDLGLLLTTSAATVVVGQVATKRWRWRHLPACVAGYLLLGVGFAACGLVTTRGGFVGATVLWSLGDLILLGRTTSIVAGLAPPGERGRYLAAYGISWGIAAVAAPLTGTHLLAAGGPTTPWIAAAATCGLLAAVQPALRRRLECSSGAAPAPGRALAAGPVGQRAG